MTVTHRTATALALALALAAALAASLPAGAQTARLGSLPPSAQVVTNEQDAAALAALNAANAVISAALTNEAALRTAGDAAGLAAINATNAVLSAAITNEAALRAAGDAAGLADLYAATGAIAEVIAQAGYVTESVTNGLATAQQVTEVDSRITAATNAIPLTSYLRRDTAEDTSSAWTLKGGASEDGDPEHRVNTWTLGTLGGPLNDPLLGITFRNIFFGSEWIPQVTTDTTYLFNPGQADSIARKADIDAVEAAKELHADSFTNLVWQSVYSNGWHWLVAYTNTTGGAE